MPALDPFVLAVGLAASVLIVSALISGLVDRTGFPPVAVFLLLGLLIGPFGMQLLDVGADSQLLRIVATLSLTFVLFTDAVSLNLSRAREHRVAALLVLGPGTIGTAALIAAAAWSMFGLAVLPSLMLGAAIASSDPVLLRGFVRRPNVDPVVRETLRIESGMNDAVLLPIVLICTYLATQHGGEGTGVGRLLLNMLVVSPLAGLAVGGAGVAALHYMRRHFGVRRDYESLYSLGLALAAYGAGEAFHGSGFLAAFVAGVAVSALDVELCDCFLEYGETTAEMALLFAFVLFGVSLVWEGVQLPAKAWLFALLVIAIRVAMYLVALAPARMTMKQRMLIAWFGPRGLATLLLIMIPVGAAVPASRDLLVLCCLVVIVSVVLHGISPLLLRMGAAGDASAERNPAEFITVEDARTLVDSGDAVIVDARAERNYDAPLPGAVRVRPDHAVHDARQQGLPIGKVLAVLCA